MKQQNYIKKPKNQQQSVDTNRKRSTPQLYQYQRRYIFDSLEKLAFFIFYKEQNYEIYQQPRIFSYYDKNLKKEIFIIPDFSVMIDDTEKIFYIKPETSILWFLKKNDIISIENCGQYIEWCNQYFKDSNWYFQFVKR